MTFTRMKQQLKPRRGKLSPLFCSTGKTKTFKQSNTYIHLSLKTNWENTGKESRVEFTSEAWKTSMDISFKKSIIKQPTRRPKGIINSQFLEMEYITSDRKLKKKSIIRDHLNAFCPTNSNCLSSKSSAFLQGNSFTESGMACNHLSLTIFNCSLALLGSPKWAFVTFIEHVGEIWWGACDSKHQRNWQGLFLNTFICKKGQGPKIMPCTNFLDTTTKLIIPPWKVLNNKKIHAYVKIWRLFNLNWRTSIYPTCKPFKITNSIFFYIVMLNQPGPETLLGKLVSLLRSKSREKNIHQLRTVHFQSRFSFFFFFSSHNHRSLALLRHKHRYNTIKLQIY